MTTINLQQNSQVEKQNLLAKGGNGGFIFSLAILVVVLLSYAGLKYYIPLVESKNLELTNSITAENANLIGLESLERIVDMQNRLSEIKNNFLFKDGKFNHLEMITLLDNLSGDLNPSNMVSDFVYSSNGEVAVTVQSNNFSDAAKQMLNFKASKYFTSAELNSIERKDNVITSVIVMKLKK